MSDTIDNEQLILKTHKEIITKEEEIKGKITYNPEEENKKGIEKPFTLGDFLQNFKGLDYEN